MSDYELQTAVARINEKRVNFALFRGEKSGQVLITPQPPQPKEIAAIEQLCVSGKCVAKGICFFEGKQLVFATKSEPSPAWDADITSVFEKEGCSKHLPILLRKLGLGESDVAGQESKTGEPPKAPATPPARPPQNGLGKNALRATWQQLNAAVTPRITAAVQGHSPNKDEILRLVQVAEDAEKTENFNGALEAFRGVVKLLVASGPAPQVSPKPSGPTIESLSVEFLILTQAIKDAAPAQAERKDEIVRAVQAFQAQIKAEQIDAAAASLRAIRALLGSAPAPNGSTIGPALAQSKTARETPTEQSQQLTGAIDPKGAPPPDQIVVATPPPSPPMSLDTERAALAARREVYRKELESLAELEGAAVDSARAEVTALLADPVDSARLALFREKFKTLRTKLAEAGKASAKNAKELMSAEIAVFGPDTALQSAKEEYEKAESKHRKTKNAQRNKAKELSAALAKFLARAQELWESRDETRDQPPQNHSSTA